MLPWPALRVGAPEPKNIPVLAVEENSSPSPAVPPAGGAVPEKAVSAPVTDSEVPVAVPITGVVSVGDVANTKAPVPCAPVEVTPSIVGWLVMVGAEMLGLVASTTLPVPVVAVMAVPAILNEFPVPPVS